MRASIDMRVPVLVPLLTVALAAVMTPQRVAAQTSLSQATLGHAVGRSLDAHARAELLEAREQVWRAWFGFDSVRLERVLPADGVIAAGGDSVWKNREQTIAESRAFARSGGRLVSIEFPRTEMQVFGNVVVIYTTFRYTIEREGQRHTSSGNAVEVFERRDGVWQNASWYMDFLSGD